MQQRKIHIGLKHLLLAVLLLVTPSLLSAKAHDECKMPCCRPAHVVDVGSCCSKSAKEVLASKCGCSMAPIQAVPSDRKLAAVRAGFDSEIAVTELAHFSLAIAKEEVAETITAQTARTRLSRGDPDAPRAPPAFP